MRILTLAVCAIVVGGSGRRLGSLPTAGKCMCSKCAATRVNLLNTWEKRQLINTAVGESCELQKPLVNYRFAFAGGGQGFESPRLQYEKSTFCK